MITQIYETQSADEARALVSLGVDHIGVLVGDGAFPREKTIGEAQGIFESVTRPASKCALTLSPNLDEILEIAHQLQPHILHIGTLPELISPQDLESIKAKFPKLLLMRSIPVVGSECIELARSYEGVADYLLLDTHQSGDSQIGATGLTHDWAISRKIVESIDVPVILAGGLGPDNVAEAIRIVRPAGVDSKTRTDVRGAHSKDLDLVGRFVENARA